MGHRGVETAGNRNCRKLDYRRGLIETTRRGSLVHSPSYKEGAIDNYPNREYVALVTTDPLGKRGKGCGPMQHHVAGVSPDGRFVDCSEGLVIECGGCGEKLLLLGREADWRSEGRMTFECGGCGKALTLKDRR